MRHVERTVGSLRAARGTSLVEALVAFLVLALTMVALGRAQGVQRASLELARQRADATRLAQQQLELARSVLPWAALANAAPFVGATPGTVVTRRVSALPDLPNAKAVAITVSWSDRSGTAQQITMGSILDGTDPVLTGALALGKAVGSTAPASPITPAAPGTPGVLSGPGTPGAASPSSPPTTAGPSTIASPLPASAASAASAASPASAPW